MSFGQLFFVKVGTVGGKGIHEGREPVILLEKIAILVDLSDLLRIEPIDIRVKAGLPAVFEGLGG